MSTRVTACPQCALEYTQGESFCAIDGARLLHVSNEGFSGDDPLIGQTLAGRYRIVRKIGQGGMGIVYEAMHVIIEKRMALKVLREDFSHRDDVVERFRQEAKSASRIGHEHIVDISDFGTTPAGANFFVMEFLQGHDLAEELDRRGPLPTRRAIELVLQCARALGAAHAKGIVHRDMKPENIFLVQRDTGEDFIKIVDFGIAKMSELDEHGQNTPGRRLTRTGMIFGTPEYMSPEHAAGKDLDHRVDVYALGIILFELLTGRVPFPGDTFMGILTAHMLEPLPSLRSVHPDCSAPRELEELIRRAAAKSADERPQSMDELVRELVRVRDHATSPLASSLPPPGTITHVERETAFAPTIGLPSVAPTGFEPPPRRSSSLWMVLPALAVAGVATFVVMRKDPPAQAVTPAIALPASLPALAPEPAPPPGPATEVTVEVVSEPAGASVEVDGRPVCAPTPCRFQAARGSTLKLALQKNGYKPGATELTPERDLNQVQLGLVKKHTRGNRMQGDLMLPDAFGNR